eukprot:c31613_g1_i1 orf=3-293(-)
MQASSSHLNYITRHLTSGTSRWSVNTFTLIKVIFEYSQSTNSTNVSFHKCPAAAHLSRFQSQIKSHIQISLCCITPTNSTEALIISTTFHCQHETWH